MASQFAIVRELGTALCKALGLDEGIVKSIHIDANEDIPIVTIERLISPSEGAAMVAVLDKYTLTPKDEPRG